MCAYIPGVRAPRNAEKCRLRKELFAFTENRIAVQVRGAPPSPSPALSFLTRTHPLSSSTSGTPTPTAAGSGSAPTGSR